jgi:hypothetical protein
MSISIQGRTSNASGYNTDYTVFSVTFEKITNFFKPIEFFFENYILFSGSLQKI